MMTLRFLRSFTFALLAGVIATVFVDASPVLAQETGPTRTTVADAATLEAAVTGHARGVDLERERLTELLADPRVRAVADARNIDMERVEARAATLSDEDLLRIETMASEVSKGLDLSNTITISVTTVIIILLLLILIT